MPINWDTFNDSVDRAIDESVTETNEKLISELSSLSTLKDAEIKDLFPNTADLKSCAELMRIVNSAADDNDKINQIVSGSEQFASVTLRLLNKFV